MCVEFNHENILIGIERRADLRAFKVVVVVTKAKRLRNDGDPVEEKGFAFYVHDNGNIDAGYGQRLGASLLEGVVIT